MIGTGLLWLLLALAVVLGGPLSIGGGMSPVPQETLAIGLGAPSADQWVGLTCLESAEPDSSHPCRLPDGPVPMGTVRLHLSLRAATADVLVTDVTIRYLNEPLSKAHRTLALPAATSSAQRSSVPSPVITTTARLPARDGAEQVTLSDLILIEEGHEAIVGITLVDAAKGGTKPWIAGFCVEVEGQVVSIHGSVGRSTDAVGCWRGVLAHTGDLITSRAPGIPSATPGLTRHSAG
ncbi:hypothetical protein [Streptomyces sp. NBC_00005]|uniref:hypothetical protein n=1 Tax=Streptomyces sp. NBC_00005 TaxID=2903609 RepID=UPI0032463F1B